MFVKILCPQQMFPSLSNIETQPSFCVPRVYAPKKHHEQWCAHNNHVSSFVRAFILGAKYQCLSSSFSFDYYDFLVHPGTRKLSFENFTKKCFLKLKSKGSKRRGLHGECRFVKLKYLIWQRNSFGPTQSSFAVIEWSKAWNLTKFLCPSASMWTTVLGFEKPSALCVQLVIQGYG